MRTCSVKDCGRAYFSRGYCRAHKARWDRTGDVQTDHPIAPPSRGGNKCKDETCDSAARSAGFCSFHYGRWFAAGNRAVGAAAPCTAEDCARPQRSRGLCERHYARWVKSGTLELSPRRKRAITPRLVSKDSGYVVLYGIDSPAAGKGGRILEHRWVMSQHLGRPLLASENVHHINGIRDDNRLENLELWSTSQPPGQRVDDKAAWAMTFLAQYKPDLLR